MASDFTIELDHRSGKLRLAGDLDLYHAHEIRRALRRNKDVRELDLSGLTRLDTVGAMMLIRLQKQGQLQLTGLKDEFSSLFDLVSKVNVAPLEEAPQDGTICRLIKRTGRKTIAAWHAAIDITEFLGHAAVSFARSMRSLRRLRINSIAHHIEEAGIQAIPIISLIAFLIAVVLAYQGVAQLKPLGGQQYTVNLVAISVTREMGVLLTAIMVAGRSGSAFAAEIGVMKVREEVDALQVIGITPFEVLVMPRLIALIIVMPLLTFIADMMGLLGGGLISTLLINIPLPQYMEHVRNVTHVHDFMVGMIKAPVFAYLIATVGCMHGLKVTGSAESVGRETTASVVKGIFLVLVADAAFSIIFQKMGI